MCTPPTSCFRQQVSKPDLSNVRGTSPVAFVVSSTGFLYVSREHKGDYALQDIYTALHWLKNYVSNFNGDPDRITLYGTETGAVLASLVAMLETVNGSFVCSARLDHARSLQVAPAR